MFGNQSFSWGESPFDRPGIDGTPGDVRPRVPTKPFVWVCALDAQASLIQIHEWMLLNRFASAACCQCRREGLIESPSKESILIDLGELLSFQSQKKSAPNPSRREVALDLPGGTVEAALNRSTISQGIESARAFMASAVTV